MTKIFRAYDKNGDGKITFEEWLAMKEGATDDPERRARERQQYSSIDRNRDGALSLEEVLTWNRSSGSRREGDAGGRRDGDRPREGDSPRRDAPREREGDGDRGPRDED
jgi:hypothetical protein